MAKAVELSKEQARRLAVYAQGLNEVPEDSLAAIRQLSYVQIDSISVAARAHHHVFQTRNSNHVENDLDRLVREKKVFEYWSHAAAFLPMDDFRFSLYPKGEVLKAEKFWFEKNKKVMRHVLRRIRTEGPLQSKDFEHPPQGANPWYEWKPAKIALQILFMEGRLMVAGRQGFQKVYNLTERVLPEGIDLKKPTQKAFCGYLADRAVKAHGLVTEAEIGYLRKGLKKPIVKVLQEKVRKKELVKVVLPDNDAVYYTTPGYLDMVDEIKPSQNLHLLSPFDNLVIQRKRLQSLFDFDYQIECYVPEKKRVYGYYTLPVLWGERFVARLDPRADRKTGVFHIKNLWLEEGFQADEAFLYALAIKLKEFAAFCGCERLVIENANPGKLKAELSARLRS
jgi:uncharacterized protein YcaQ